MLKAATTPDEEERLTAVRTLLAEEARMGMMVGVAVGWALAEELAATGRTEPGGLNQMEIRLLGHACFELVDGDTRVLVDPFLKPNNPAAQ